MKSPALGGNRSAGFPIGNDSNSNCIVANQDSGAQEPPFLNDGIHITSIWRGPRDRSRAVQFSIRRYNGHEFLDIREYANSSGYMIPTKRGLTLATAQLGKFAQAAGKAYRVACSRGMITARST